MKIGNKFFDFKKNAYIMGILNVTPDSFSDGGSYQTLQQAIDHVAQMIEDGVDMIDIGGESTRPGHTQISCEEEIERIIPVIEAIKKRFDIPLSVDCYRSETAEAALKAGVHMINDIWGFHYDPQLANLIKEYQIPYCLMHNRFNENYTNFLADILQDLHTQINFATESGISKSQIILDPGIGFAKSRQQDALLLKNLSLLDIFECPILLGTSRKRVINAVINRPVHERDHATAATTVYGYLNGARLFRVHNVRYNRDALDMVMALEGDLINE